MKLVLYILPIWFFKLQFLENIGLSYIGSYPALQLFHKFDTHKN